MSASMCDRMADDAAMHARVDRLEVVDLLGRLAQLIERRRSGGAKGVVLQELIAIDEPDFPGRRLRNEVENIRTAPAKADEWRASPRQSLRKRADAGAVGSGLGVVEDVVVVARARAPRRCGASRPASGPRRARRGWRRRWSSSRSSPGSRRRACSRSCAWPPGHCRD